MLATGLLNRSHIAGLAAIIVLSLGCLRTWGSPPVFDTAAWRFYRSILASQGPAEGFSAIYLDPSITDKCRPDLADLQVVSSDGYALPCVVVEAGGSPAPRPFPVKVFRISRQGDQFTDIWIDKTAKVLTQGILIDTSSRDFVRRVELRGSDNAREEYVIKMNGLILNSQADPSISSLTVTHPLNGHQYVHIRVLDQDEAPLKVLGVQCFPPSPAKASEPPVDLRITENRVDSGSKSTAVVAEMAGKTFPLHHVAITTPAKAFRKKVVISGSNVLSSSEWEKIHEDAFFRVHKELAVAEKLDATFPPRAFRYLKVELSGGTPDPVPVENILARATVKALIFRQNLGETCRVYYGNNTAQPPPKLPEGTNSDLHGLLAASSPGARGEETRVTVAVTSRPTRPPAPEKRPLAYGNLVGIGILILGCSLLLLMALRARSSARRDPMRGTRLVRSRRHFR